MIELLTTAEVIHWRGPSPYYFARLADNAGAAISEIAPAVSYGWGAIMTRVVINDFEWTTAIFPKDGTYLVPLKKLVREHLNLEIGIAVQVFVSIPA